MWVKAIIGTGRNGYDRLQDKTFRKQITSVVAGQPLRRDNRLAVCSAMKPAQAR
jgi:hypothetical protein